MIIKGEREVLEKKAAWILAESIQEISDQQNHVVLAVPGGRSVSAILKKMEFEPVDWQKVHFFMVDERLVSIHHADSNFKLLASCVDPFVERANLHPFIHNPSNSQNALNSYKQLLREYGGQFDIVLLSSGEDGHIASLFPEHETFASKEDLFILTKSAPKPPPARMTASKRLITSSRVALLLFFGAQKQNAFTAYSDDQVPVSRCPAKIVKTIQQHYILTDLHN
ncbi:MAG: 6-phosphogluconolactonase [Desulfobacterales bacterium]|nr:6-phosphogluconolactonase [Deltaproteobacteria bacterium]NNK96277.1 6-phosphogluconolactonase [Desulfobacterales bacterium]